jgi:hypothetical protein
VRDVVLGQGAHLTPLYALFREPYLSALRRMRFCECSELLLREPVRAEVIRRRPVALVHLGEKSTHHLGGRPRRELFEVPRVRMRAQRRCEDPRIALGRKARFGRGIVGDDGSTSTPTAASMSATTTPVRSLPTVQCTRAGCAASTPRAAATDAIPGVVDEAAIQLGQGHVTVEEGCHGAEEQRDPHDVELETLDATRLPRDLVVGRRSTMRRTPRAPSAARPSVVRRARFAERYSTRRG